MGLFWRDWMKQLRKSLKNDQENQINKESSFFLPKTE